MTTYPYAYVSFLVEFHASRDFFECHELLEEYWKEHPGDPLALTWVGFIQLAVGLYHLRRGNVPGALKMLMQAEQKLSAAPLESLGIERSSLLKELSTRIETLQNGVPFEYTDMNMTITDERLLTLCLTECAKRGWTWNARSPLEEEAVIHRHTRRDRSAVIAAREEALAAKQKEREGRV